MVWRYGQGETLRAERQWRRPGRNSLHHAGAASVHQYYIDGSPAEQALAARIDKLWREVDWNFYRQNGQNVLYWHWSSEYGWEMNFPVHGYNECLIMYILAAASPTHGVQQSITRAGRRTGPL